MLRTIEWKRIEATKSLRRLTKRCKFLILIGCVYWFLTRISKCACRYLSVIWVQWVWCLENMTIWTYLTPWRPSGTKRQPILASTTFNLGQCKTNYLKLTLTTSSTIDLAFCTLNRTISMRVACMTQKHYIYFKRLNRSLIPSKSKSNHFGSYKQWSLASSLEESLGTSLTWVLHSARSSHNYCRSTTQSMRWNFSRKSACSTWMSTCWSMECTWWRGWRALITLSSIECETV